MSFLQERNENRGFLNLFLSVSILFLSNTIFVELIDFFDSTIGREKLIISENLAAVTDYKSF